MAKKKNDELSMTDKYTFDFNQTEVEVMLELLHFSIKTLEGIIPTTKGEELKSFMQMKVNAKIMYNTIESKSIPGEIISEVKH